MSVGLRVGIRTGIRAGIAPGISTDEISSAGDPLQFPTTGSGWTAIGAPVAPNALFQLQETSGAPADSIGTTTLTAPSAAPAYHQSVVGWSRFALRYTNQASPNQYWSHANAPVLTLASNSCMMLALARMTGAPSTDGAVLSCGTTTTVQALVTSASKFKIKAGANSATGTASPGTTVHPIVMVVNRTATTVNFYTDQEQLTPTWDGTITGAQIALGGTPAITLSGPIDLLGAACWYGANAEMTTNQVRTLLQGMGVTGIPW